VRYKEIAHMLVEAVANYADYRSYEDAIPSAGFSCVEDGRDLVEHENYWSKGYCADASCDWKGPLYFREKNK